MQVISLNKEKMSTEYRGCHLYLTYFRLAYDEFKTKYPKLYKTAVKGNKVIVLLVLEWQAVACNQNTEVPCGDAKSERGVAGYARPRQWTCGLGEAKRRWNVCPLKCGWEGDNVQAHISHHHQLHPVRYECTVL